MAKLSAKQQLFVDEYLIDLNATQAYIRAGYKNFDSAGVEANKTLNIPKVRAAVDAALAERSRRTGINQDRVVEELAKLAFVKASDVIDVNTATVLPDAKPEDLACIQSVKIKLSVSQSEPSRGVQIIHAHQPPMPTTNTISRMNTKRNSPGFRTWARNPVLYSVCR